VHALFGIVPGSLSADTVAQDIVAARRNVLKQKKLVVIFDELSMIEAVIGDGIESGLRQLRRNDDPFGDVQTVWFGDFLQLVSCMFLSF
jgi:ATP-dependent DNA helicase PIF1